MLKMQFEKSRQTREFGCTVRRDGGSALCFDRPTTTTNISINIVTKPSTGADGRETDLVKERLRKRAQENASYYGPKLPAESETRTRTTASVSGRESIRANPSITRHPNTSTSPFPHALHSLPPPPPPTPPPSPSPSFQSTCAHTCVIIKPSRESRIDCQQLSSGTATSSSPVTFFTPGPVSRTRC